MKNNLFFYWDGPNTPNLISLLREIIFLHSDNGTKYEPIFLNDNNISEFIVLPKHYDKLIYAHKADYIRVAIVNKFGGVYIDSDTLLKPDFYKMYDLFSKKDGFFVRTIEGHICNGIFGSKKNTPFLNDWQEIAKNKIEKNKGKLGWTDIGSQIINYEIERSKLSQYQILNGVETVYPVYWKDCVKEFIQKPESNIKKIQKQFQPAIVLVNSVYKEISNLSREEIIYMKNPLGLLLRQTLGEENENKF